MTHSGFRSISYNYRPECYVCMCVAPNDSSSKSDLSFARFGVLTITEAITGYVLRPALRALFPPADHMTLFSMLSTPLSRPLATAPDFSHTPSSLDASKIARRDHIQRPADETSSPLATSHDIIRKCVQLFGGAFWLF